MNEVDQISHRDMYLTFVCTFTRSLNLCIIFNSLKHTILKKINTQPAQSNFLFFMFAILNLKGKEFYEYLVITSTFRDELKYIPPCIKS